MKTFNRSVLVVVALASFNLAVLVGAEDYTYTTNNGAITITKYIGPGGDVTIPSAIHEIPVTTIDYGAFWSCTNVTSIAIPESVDSISDGVFTGCNRLEAFAVDPANPAYSSLDGVLFNQAQTALIRCPQAKAGHYTVPGSVTRIDHAAFASCSGLSSVTLPDTIVTIAPDAFYWCTSLTDIVIPSGVNSIASWTFSLATTTPPSITSQGRVVGMPPLAVVRQPSGCPRSRPAVPTLVSTPAKWASMCSGPAA